MRKGDIAYSIKTDAFWNLTEGERHDVLKVYWCDGAGEHLAFLRKENGSVIKKRITFFEFATKKRDAISKTFSVGQRVRCDLLRSSVESIIYEGTVDRVISDKLITMRIDTENGHPIVVPNPHFSHVYKIFAI